MTDTRKIIDYKVLLNDSASELSQQVKDNIKDGWQPFGAPFISDVLFTHQAMVKYEEATG